MSVVRPRPPEDPIDYVLAGHLAGEALRAIAGRLEGARGRMADAPVSAQPDRLLADYKSNRTTSELFAILQAARRIREAVDRVIVVGGEAATAGVRALFAALCHPFHNELPRGERGGRPRLSFEGGGFDNDRMQGLLDLVAPAGRRPSDDLLDRWAILVTGDGDGTRATTAATRLLLAALDESVGGDRRRLAERFVPIASRPSSLADLARAIGCPEVFGVPAGVAAPASVFTAVGLLPASIVGIDVVQLLEGAAAMNRRFHEAPVADNPVLQHAAVMHLAGGVRLRAGGSRMLDAMGAWYGVLAGEAVMSGDTARPASVGAAAGCVTNLVAGEPRRDRLTLPPLGPYGHDEDGLDDRVGTTWPDMQAAVRATHPEQPTAEIRLPRIDEHAVGQLLQMLMLATVVEGIVHRPSHP